MSTSKRTKSFVAILMAVMMMFAVTACSATPTSTPIEPTTPSATEAVATATPAIPEPTSLPPITLTMGIALQEEPNPGIQNNVVVNEIVKYTGISLDMVPFNEEKLKVLIAGGDVPDIFELEGNAAATGKELIDSQTVIPLDDLLDQYGQNIKKNQPIALKYQKNVIGKGKTYFLSCWLANESTIPESNSFVGFFTRFDIYQEIGAPEIKGEDDYLNALKQMQEKHPTTSDGKKVYALSGFSDWGLWPWFSSYPYVQNNNAGNSNILINASTGECQNPYLQADGVFWNGLKFFNKAYQLGIFDPEAFTMKSDQYAQKIGDGEVLTAYGNWWGPDIKICGDKAGMFVLPGAFPYIHYVTIPANPLGMQMSSARGISTNCKYPDRAMMLYNWLDSNDGIRTVFNGAKGVDWDVIDGVPQLVGNRLKSVTDPTFVDPADTDGTLRGLFKLQKFVSFKFGALDDGYPLDLTNTLDLIVKRSEANVAAKNFSSFYGADLVYPGQVYDKFVKDGKTMATTAMPLFTQLTGNLSDDSTRAFSKAEEYFNANISQIIMAKSDADFDAQRQKAITAVKGMGLEAADQEFRSLLQKAQEEEGSFK